MILSSPKRIQDLRSRGLWPDLQFDQLLQRNIERVPDREAIVDPPNRPEISHGVPRRITWRGLGDAVDVLHQNLARCGLGKDDIVVVQMANTWELFAVYLACFRRGIVVSPVPALYREHELGYIIERTAAKALITNTRISKHSHGAMALRLRDLHPCLSLIILLGDASDIPDDALDLSTMLCELSRRVPDSTEAIAGVCADDVVTVMWTSGSEGRPKGVPRSHAQWLVSLSSVAKSFHMPDGVRLLNARPLVTHGAMLGTILPWLDRAGTVVLHQPFTLDLYVRQLCEERINFTSIAPAILASLLSEPQLLDGVDFERLRSISSGSAPLSPTLIREFETRFGIRVGNLYGSTEGASLGSTADDIPDPDLRATLFPRLGVPGFGWKYPSGRLQESILIDPATSAEIKSAGQPGELRIRGPIIFDGYFNAPELTASAFDSNGFYRSGDLFELAGDKLQYYRYVGRLKDIIIRGGFNVSAAEVENLVSAYPGIKEVGAVGIPDQRLGERIGAIIAMRPGQEAPSLDKLVDFLRTQFNVASIKLPERLIVVDALPRNANTKIDKVRLRALISAPLC